MKGDKQKIIDFAKELYTCYDSEGKKVYSFRDIATEIQRECNKKVNYATVQRWAKKYDWDKLNEKIKRQSIEKATDEKFLIEEQIVEAESDKLAKDYINAEKLSDIGFKLFVEAYNNKKEHEVIKIKEALTAIKLGTDIKLRISGLPEVADKDKPALSINITKQASNDLDTILNADD